MTAEKTTGPKRKMLEEPLLDPTAQSSSATAEFSFTTSVSPSTDLQPPDGPASVADTVAGEVPSPEALATRQLSLDNAASLAHTTTEPQERTIWIPQDVKVEEGAQLGDGVYVGRLLDGGFQGGVYELKGIDGEALPWLLKTAGKCAPISNMEREWLTGQLLNQLVDQGVSGFMRMGRAVRHANTGKMRAFQIEKLEGKTVNKVVTQPGFNDVHYLRDMLRQVFQALDQAQKQLGFHHSDLRLANVMEHSPEGRRDARQFKIIDLGLAKFDEAYPAGRKALPIEGATPHEQQRLGVAANTNKHDMLPASSPHAIEPENFFEKTHRSMWRRKGDVYHLLLEVMWFLDERIWPRTDECDVRLLLAMMEHVTGVRLKASFSDDAALQARAANAAPALRSRGNPLHWLRIGSLGFQAWQSPFNPGLTAAEVLTSPFFAEAEAALEV